MTALRITNDDHAPDIMEGTGVTGGETFADFADSLPSDARVGFERVQQPAPGLDVNAFNGAEEGTDAMSASRAPDPQQARDQREKRIKMSRKMKAAMKKLEDRISSFPALYFDQQAKNFPEWKLDDDERDMVTESVSFLLEILNIEFMIEPLDVTLTSIWWVISYPVLVIGFIFMSHREQVKANHPEAFAKDNEKD